MLPWFESPLGGLEVGSPHALVAIPGPSFLNEWDNESSHVMDYQIYKGHYSMCFEMYKAHHLVCCEIYTELRSP